MKKKPSAKELLRRQNQKDVANNLLTLHYAKGNLLAIKKSKGYPVKGN